RDGEVGEDVEQAPGAAAASVFEHRLDERDAPAGVGGDADVVEHALGGGIAVGERGLAATLDVEVEVDGNARAAGPGRIGRELAVADEIARDHRVGPGLERHWLAHASGACCGVWRGAQSDACTGRASGAEQAS